MSYVTAEYVPVAFDNEYLYPVMVYPYPGNGEGSNTMDIDPLPGVALTINGGKGVDGNPVDTLNDTTLLLPKPTAYRIPFAMTNPQVLLPLGELLNALAFTMVLEDKSICEIVFPPWLAAYK